jgi:hypothetical protein
LIIEGSSARYKFIGKFSDGEASPGRVSKFWNIMPVPDKYGTVGDVPEPDRMVKNKSAAGTSCCAVVLVISCEGAI